MCRDADTREPPVSARLPITLDVTGRTCVVIGGGPMAADRAGALAAAGAVTVEVAAGGYRPELLDGAFVAIVTGEDDTDAATVFADAEPRGVLVNTLDDVAHCHFAFPATIVRGDVRVAISTGGRAPALARRLRLYLEERVPGEVALLADALAEARTEALPRTVPLDEWIANWRSALEDLDALLALCRDQRPDLARDRVLATVSGGAPA